MKLCYLVFAFGCAWAVACAPAARPDGMGSPGDKDGGPSDAKPGTGGTTVPKGGAGGTAGSGGKGGAGGLGGVGGVGGLASGGAAAGGVAGNPGTGGMPAATGGMPMATGGAPMPPPGPIAKPTAAALFAGNTNAASALVGGDPAAGYFYSGSPSVMSPKVAPIMLAAADQAGLPAGTVFAQQSLNTTAAATSALIILGFNFRPNDGVKWRWIDSSDYPGLTFWARAPVGGPIEVNVTSVDGTNISNTHEAMGKCTVEPCIPIHGKVVSVTNTWTQFKFKWTDFSISAAAVPQGPVEPKQMGRIDLLFVVPDGSTVDMQITGVKLATAAELP